MKPNQPNDSRLSWKAIAGLGCGVLTVLGILVIWGAAAFYDWLLLESLQGYPRQINQALVSKARSGEVDVAFEDLLDLARAGRIDLACYGVLQLQVQGITADDEVTDRELDRVLRLVRGILDAGGQLTADELRELVEPVPADGDGPASEPSSEKATTLPK